MLSVLRSCARRILGGTDEEDQKYSVVSGNIVVSANELARRPKVRKQIEELKHRHEAQQSSSS